jgi:GTPase SAR1 family protein
MNQSQQLLIIGGPNVGKTHFIGQLYNRLVAKRSTFHMVTAPADLTVIKAVIDRLAQGLAGEHTQSGLNEEIHFVVANNQAQIALTFPDYAGEQVRGLVRDRLVSSRWYELIIQSSEWLLLIRPDEIQPLEDITTRGFANVEDLQARAAKFQQEAQLTAPSFYIELLQMMLFIKGKSVIEPISEPRLTVALSCWDTLKLPVSGVTPIAEMQERLPFLAAFLETVWNPTSWRVCGLSSLGRTLDTKLPDEDFVDEGPDTMGYVVLPSGKHDSDLTRLITFDRV